MPQTLQGQGPQLRDLGRTPKFFQVQSSFHTKCLLQILKFSWLKNQVSCNQSLASSLQPASCNQFLSISYFQPVPCNQFLATVIADVYKQLLWQFQHKFSNLLVVIYFYQTKGWTLKHHHLECFKVNSWKKFLILR